MWKLVSPFFPNPSRFCFKTFVSATLRGGGETEDLSLVISALGFPLTLSLMPFQLCVGKACGREKFVGKLQCSFQKYSFCLDWVFIKTVTVVFPLVIATTSLNSDCVCPVLSSYLASNPTWQLSFVAHCHQRCSFYGCLPYTPELPHVVTLLRTKQVFLVFPESPKFTAIFSTLWIHPFTTESCSRYSMGV